MSPEAALLVRAALLGLLVFAIERFGRRRQARRADLRRTETVVRLPATQQLRTPPLVGRPLQVSAEEKSIRPLEASSVKLGRTDILKLPHTVPTYVVGEYPYDGHVTEKRAA